MTTNDGITDHEQYAAACRYQNGFLGPVDPITAFMAGSEWARTHLAAQVSTEAETPDPSVDYHAMWWKAEREREKAERERDEARVRGGEYLIRAEKAEDMRDRWKATANSADDVIRAVLRELGAGPDTDPVLKAKAVCDARDAWREVAKQKGSEQPRPLTPDAITDEMVERARNAPSFDGRLSPTPRLVREMLTAALTEPPARPEWVGKAGVVWASARGHRHVLWQTDDDGAHWEHDGQSVDWFVLSDVTPLYPEGVRAARRDKETDT